MKSSKLKKHEHIIIPLEIIVDCFIEIIQKQKAFSNPIESLAMFKEHIGKTALWALQNQKYFLQQVTLTEQRKIWKNLKKTLSNQSLDEPAYGLTACHMGCRTALDAAEFRSTFLAGLITVENVIKKVNYSLRITKAKGGLRKTAEFNSQIISQLIPIFLQYQSSSSNKQYKIGWSTGMIDEKLDVNFDGKNTRKPTEFTIFCDLFFDTFLDIKNLNSYKSDIIIKARKKYNKRI